MWRFMAWTCLVLLGSVGIAGSVRADSWQGRETLSGGVVQGYQPGGSTLGAAPHQDILPPPMVDWLGTTPGPQGGLKSLYNIRLTAVIPQRLIEEAYAPSRRHKALGRGFSQVAYHAEFIPLDHTTCAQVQACGAMAGDVMGAGDGRAWRYGWLGGDRVRVESLMSSTGQGSWGASIGPGQAYYAAPQVAAWGIGTPEASWRFYGRVDNREWWRRRRQVPLLPDAVPLTATVAVSPPAPMMLVRLRGHYVLNAPLSLLRRKRERTFQTAYVVRLQNPAPLEERRGVGTRVPTPAMTAPPDTAVGYAPPGWGR